MKSIIKSTILLIIISCSFVQTNSNSSLKKHIHQQQVAGIDQQQNMQFKKHKNNDQQNQVKKSANTLRFIKEDGSNNDKNYEQNNKRQNSKYTNKQKNLKIQNRMKKLSQVNKHGTPPVTLGNVIGKKKEKQLLSCVEILKQETDVENQIVSSGKTNALKEKFKEILMQKTKQKCKYSCEQILKKKTYVETQIATDKTYALERQLKEILEQSMEQKCGGYCDDAHKKWTTNYYTGPKYTEYISAEITEYIDILKQVDLSNSPSSVRLECELKCDLSYKCLGMQIKNGKICYLMKLQQHIAKVIKEWIQPSDDFMVSEKVPHTSGVSKLHCEDS